MDLGLLIEDIHRDLMRLPRPSQDSGHWSKRSIYRIPASSVSDANRAAYVPHRVSLGPYHHGLDTLKPMEEHKCRALLRFLMRSDILLPTLVYDLYPVVGDLRDAYDQLDPKWDDIEKFMRMLIMDGCFILEILHVATITTTTAAGPRPPPPAPPHSESLKEIQHPAEDHALENDYALNDPIFSNHGKIYTLPFLRRDMLMLENQLPILLLEKLVSFQKDKSLKDRKDLTRSILKFFGQYYISVSPRNLHHFDQSLHILDVYRRSLLLHVPKPKTTRFRGGDDEEIMIRSATELNEAGIRIEKNRSRSLGDISFRNGVLRLPLIVVDDALESLFLNLIAYERSHVGAGNEITSYVFFMDSILHGARDVRLLHTCGIILNALPGDEAVVGLFHAVSKDVTLDPEGNLEEVVRSVVRYCRRPWRRWRARVVHTYFTNPWASLSFAGSLFLFALTIVQTVYGVLSYFRSPL